MESRLSLLLALMMTLTEVKGHGRLIEPPSRASMYKYGYNTHATTRDNMMECGGFWRQWGINKGKCGICGDPFDEPEPRDYETGGRYATGTITRNYTEGQIIYPRVEITAAHKGYFEYRLCPRNDPDMRATHECLDQYILRQPNGNTKFYGITQSRIYTTPLVLPTGVTCSHCVLQWKYNTGNSWGTDKTGSCLGCGAQEQFYACADVSITKRS